MSDTPNSNLHEGQVQAPREASSLDKGEPKPPSGTRTARAAAVHKGRTRSRSAAGGTRKDDVRASAQGAHEEPAGIDDLLRPGHNRRASAALDLLHDDDVTAEKAHAVILSSAESSYRAEVEGESSKLDVAIMIATLVRQSRRGKRGQVLKTLPEDLAEQLDKSGNAIKPEHYVRNLNFARDEGANASARSRVKKAAEFLVEKHENSDAEFLDYLMTVTSMNQLKNERLARPGRDDHQTKAAEKKQKAREKVVADRESAGVVPYGEGGQLKNGSKAPERREIGLALVRRSDGGLEVLGCVVGKSAKDKKTVKARVKDMIKLFCEQEDVKDKDLKAVAEELDAVEAE